MYCLPDNILSQLTNHAGASVLCDGLRGLEKESLRISEIDGQLSQAPHPEALGAALTHPFITTDFAESLLEFVTPALKSNRDAIKFLHDLHSFTYAQIPGEALWPCSMPCGFSAHSDVPLARYGNSNVGQMKTVYRRGLGLRYGRIMQTIAGVHFNYSLPEAFWPALQATLQCDRELQEFKSTGYFGLIRNFKRLSWIVLYLFGSSPAVCKTFFQGHTSDLSDVDEYTAAGEFATSLRMSDIGYSNHAQSSLNISLNSLEEYVAGLTRAISTPHPPYEKIGLYEGKKRLQLSTNILQIANEFYSVARPKRVAHSGEEPTAALRRRGVEYVEIRSLDLDPFSPAGVNKKQLDFMECLLLHCALTNSPVIGPNEQVEIAANDNRVATKGREPGLVLSANGASISLQDWATQICSSMLTIADVLDKHNKQSDYRQAVEFQMARVADPDQTPSSQLLRMMEADAMSYHAFGMSRAKQLAAEYRSSTTLSAKTVASLTAVSALSRQKAQEVEAGDSMSFEEYLRHYFELSFA